jgi:HD-GYP domain-containing protein (c-di-GMP phosphodiesterase class II)
MKRGVKRDVLEAYLGVTLKRLFVTGPDAFDEIYQRLRQFTNLCRPPKQSARSSNSPTSLPQSILKRSPRWPTRSTQGSYTQGHSQKSPPTPRFAEGLGMSDAEVEEIRLGAVLHD